MPGIRWTDAELEILRSMRESGVSIPTLLAEQQLPGRSKDSITQQLRRQGWVDRKHSERCRSVRRLTPAEHRVFMEFLRKHSTAPIAQLVSSWNDWAVPKDWAPVSFGIVLHWIEKTNLPHDRSTAWNSKWSKRKRSNRRARTFATRLAAFEMACSLELSTYQSSAKAVQKRKSRSPTCRCGNCGHRWPLKEQFFARLPNSFAFGGVPISGLQTEFCQYCNWMFKRKLALLRAFDKDVEELLVQRRSQRRKGMDKAFEELKRKAIAEARKIFRSDPAIPRRTCIRCKCRFPLKRRFFLENRGTADGEPTYRALCTYCDHFYETQIDRASRDGLDPAPLKAELQEFLAQARDRVRKARRRAARARREELMRRNLNLSCKSCKTCEEPWIIDLRYASEFWHVGSAYSRVTGKLAFYVGHECIFCKSDRESLARRQERGRS